MTYISLKGDLSDLTADLNLIRKEVRPKMREVVRDGIKAGTVLAKDNAKRSAGKHGKRYPAAITPQMGTGLGLFGTLISGEYGPERDRPQGDMSFEFGSVNQKPHLDLARSADIIGPQFEREVGNAVGNLFWPGAK